MSIPTPLTDTQPAAESGMTPDPDSNSDTLAYIELSRRESFALAHALIGHCRRVGAPRTALQHDIAGLRDFLMDVLAEHDVRILLESI